jgi:hypothetical protein
VQIPVLVESIAGDRYRAESPAPFKASAEGASTEEAVSKLREQLQHDFANGRQIVMLDVPLPDENPWIKYAGHLKDEPLLEDWRAAIEEYRSRRDPEGA